MTRPFRDIAEKMWLKQFPDSRADLFLEEVTLIEQAMDMTHAAAIGEAMRVVDKAEGGSFVWPSPSQVAVRLERMRLKGDF